MADRDSKERACCSDMTDRNITKVGTLRFIGAMCMIISAIEFGLGSSIYDFLSYPYLLDGRGSWWAGIFVFIAGLCACLANTRSSVIAAAVFATLGFCLAGLGTAADGMETYTMMAYSSCGSVNIDSNNTQTINNYNDVSGTIQCLSSQTDAFAFTASSCYCIPSNGDSVCTRYNLNRNSRKCDDLLGSYTTQLTASVVFCSFNFLFGLILSMLSCNILCKSSEIRSPEAIGHLKWLRDENTEKQIGIENTNIDGDNSDGGYEQENYETYENNYLEYDHPRANVGIAPLDYERNGKIYGRKN